MVLERVAASEPYASYPRCTDGARACPPENIDGVRGFADYVEMITNPKHGEYDEFREWNGPFDPARFDSTKATQRMRKGPPAW